jgi:hypothetical protein
MSSPDPLTHPRGWDTHADRVDYARPVLIAAQCTGTAWSSARSTCRRGPLVSDGLIPETTMLVERCQQHLIQSHTSACLDDVVAKLLRLVQSRK